jgi:multiple sugar transport system permease protein
MAEALVSRPRTGRDPGSPAAHLLPLVRFVYIGVFLLFLLLPLYWMVITSIKPVSEYLAIPPVWFPSEPTFVHYTAALYSYRGMQGLINSLIIASATTVFSVAVGTLMAYSLARFNTGGQHLAFWVLSQRFLPPIAVVLPVFLLYRNYGLNDTHIGMILVYTVFSLPFSVWMMYAYFRQMPQELENAALVDGCTRWQALRAVALPLAAPGIVTAAVFAFIFAWTEFFFALILTSRVAFTLPSIFRSFLGFQGSQYGESSALTVISLVPSIALGLLVQRHLVRGLTLGALHE